MEKELHEQRDQEFDDEMEEELDPVCMNCGNFFQDFYIAEGDKEKQDWGVCIVDPAFEPYLETGEIFENADFSCCRELYIEKRFDGMRDACPEFAVIEEISDEELEQLRAIERANYIKKMDMAEYLSMLYSSNPEERNKGLNAFFYCDYLENPAARQGLLKYYSELPPATTLEDVHFRMEIVNHFDHGRKDQAVIEALVGALLHTPSNNTTKQLYQKVLDIAQHYPVEMKEKPLTALLEQGKLGSKMKENILNVMYYDFSW